MVVMVENEQVTGTLPSRLRDRNGAERAGEIPNTPSEYEREDNSVQNFMSAADGRRERENQRPRRETLSNGNGTSNGISNGYGQRSNSRNQPPQLNGEAGRAYADFMRGQQTPNGNTTQHQSPNPYAHRANEGHQYSYQAQQQRPQTRGEQQQPVGPGKVSTESEGEDEGMMGQGRGLGMDGFIGGEGSPRLRNGGWSGGRLGERV